jgi:trimethylamine:corrinoid methyltransferase-like protein
VFEGFSPGLSFRAHPHTRRWYRQEHILSGLADRDTYEAWVAAGRTSIVDKAHTDVLRRLAASAARPLAGAVRKDLDGIMAAYGRSAGLAALPKLDL